MPKGKPSMVLARGRRLCGVCRQPIDGKGRDHTFCRVDPGGSQGGHLARGQVPLKIADGFSSRWNTPLEEYLMGQSEWQRMMRALSERQLDLEEIFTAHVNGGERLKDIAARLGKPEGTIRRRFHDARALVREWREKQEDDVA